MISVLTFWITKELYAFLKTNFKTKCSEFAFTSLYQMMNLVKLEEQLNSVKLFNSFSVKVLWLHHFSHFKLDWTSHQGIHCEELPPGCRLNGQLYHDFSLHNSVTSDSCVPGAKIRT